MNAVMWYCSAWKGVSKTWLRAIVVTPERSDAFRTFVEIMGLGRRRAGIVVREVTEWEQERWCNNAATCPVVYARVARRKRL